MKISSIIVVMCLFANAHCMEDLFGIQPKTYQLDGSNVTEYRMGNILVIQTACKGAIPHYSGTIKDLVLGPSVAQETFDKLRLLLEAEKALQAKKAGRAKKVR